MKKITTIAMFTALSLQNVFAFDVVNLKNTKIKENTKVITKLDTNESKIEGRLIGTAQLENIPKEEQLEQEKFRINIAWSEFINSDGSKIQFNANELTSTILSKTDTLKLKQKIAVQGNLNVLNQTLSTLQNKNDDGEQTKETKSFTIPSSSSSSKDETATELAETELKQKEISGVSCDANFDLTAGTAQIYVEEYYVKDDGSKLITKDCYATQEILPIQYESCSFVHEFNKGQSWKKEKPYVNSSYGTKSIPCMITSDAIAHQYDDTKCSILVLDGDIALVQAKRFIQVDGKTIYISDCEILDQTGVEVDLRGCSVNLYDVVESSYQVYPSGKRYVIQGDKRVYIDSSCKVLIDFGKSWQTRFHRYKNNDSNTNYNGGHSEEWQMYFYDFSEYEGGGITDIKEYYTGINHTHVHFRTDIIKANSCGGAFSNNHWHDRYYFWKRPDNSVYSHYAYGLCQ